jgi:peptidoglycan pentaglycine glycine transferase (the first glycine)
MTMFATIEKQSKTKAVNGISPLRVRVTHVAPDRRQAWNRFVAQAPSLGLLQSWEWGLFKEKLGWKVYRIAAETDGRVVAGAQMLIKPLPLGIGSIAYVPRGPVGEWLDEAIAPLLFSELHRTAQEHKAIFLKVEPPLANDPAIGQRLERYGFQPSSYAMQPQATIVLDLVPDADDILKQMRRSTRYNIRHAAKKGVSVRVGGRDDLPAFYDLMQTTGRRGGFLPRTRGYYEHEWQTFAEHDQAVLLMAYYQDQLLAARMAFRFGDRAADIHAAASNEHRNLHANYLLVWELVQWAKAHGCRSYDLWGIPNEVGKAVDEGHDPPAPERTDGLWGVYHFKKGFGQDVAYYLGAYDYPYSTLLYRLSINKFFSANTLDRISARLDLIRGA